MDARPDQPRVSLSSPADVIAVIPHLLGFMPEASLVVLGLAPPRGQVRLTVRYDLPALSDTHDQAALAEHAVGVLSGSGVPAAIVVGYGPGPLVTPVVEAIRGAARSAGLDLRDALRVDDSRYWSYLCPDPSCCPAEGVPFDTGTQPATAQLAAAGLPVLPDRAALAATIAAVTGAAADEMGTATRAAERTAQAVIARGGERAFAGRGLAAVQAAISTYRAGGTVSGSYSHAWLALALISLRIRDDAWARMDPEFRDAHHRLWADVARRAQPGYVAGPASLLAFTAWQRGDGALANIAIDRALADVPGYSMALLVREAIDQGVPPAMAALPMTPAEVGASYPQPPAAGRP